MIFKRINFGLVIFMLVSSLVLSLVEYIDISRFFVYMGLIVSISLPFIFYKTNYRLSDKQLILYYTYARMITLEGVQYCVCLRTYTVFLREIYIRDKL